jgi:hypothetical protein
LSSRSEDYRRRAREAEEQARTTRDLKARKIYEDIARRWNELAEQVERHNW